MEKPPLPKTESREPEENLIEELALDVGLQGVTFPNVETEAYTRLWETCKEYSKEVHFEMIGRVVDQRESQSRRRQLHNQLCIMIFGLDHNAVGAKDPKNLQRIANLAHHISGREQYVEEV